MGQTPLLIVDPMRAEDHRFLPLVDPLKAEDYQLLPFVSCEGHYLYLGALAFFVEPEVRDQCLGADQDHDMKL